MERLHFIHRVPVCRWLFSTTKCFSSSTRLSIKQFCNVLGSYAFNITTRRMSEKRGAFLVTIGPIDKRHKPIQISDQQQNKNNINNSSSSNNNNNASSSSSGCSLLSSVTLGRSDFTQIQGKRCSREQTKISIDSESSELVIQHLGSNKGCLVLNNNSCSISSNNSSESCDGDGKDHLLAKYTTKRIPLRETHKKHQTGEVNKLLSPSPLCTIWLLGIPEKEYGYHIHYKKLENEKVDQKTSHHHEKSKTLSNGDERKVDVEKRKSSTLDCFISKKQKLNDGSSSTIANHKAGVWESYPKLQVEVFHSAGVEGRPMLAGFDMDCTLIIPASGKKWPQHKDDWTWMLPEVPGKLNKLHSEGYKIVIFTNQAGIAKGTVKCSDIKHKIEALISKLKVPAQAIISTGAKGYYRKPAPGMWEYITTKCNDGVDVVTSKSLYVGDGAGRLAGWAPEKKKDFACSDRLFAINAGVSFHTPEPFFQGKKEAPFELPEFDPVQALKVTQLLEPKSARLTSVEQEVIVMVGFPGSGKSHFSLTHLASYERVNRDKLGSWQKCVTRCTQALKEGKSVVVDNTNPDIESRARYIGCAKQVKVRCFVMTTSYKQARHNEKYRQMIDPSHSSINEMIVHSYKKKYEEPDLSEGFSEIIKVNFVPSFEEEKKKRLYRLHLLDK